MLPDDGIIKSNCPACLEPDVLWLAKFVAGGTNIQCDCGFYVNVPPGPNPSEAVALKIIGANELGERQAGDRRLLVHEGEAQDAIPADEREIP